VDRDLKMFKNANLMVDVLAKNSPHNWERLANQMGGKPMNKTDEVNPILEMINS